MFYPAPLRDQTILDKVSRYDLRSSSQDEFEPGSNGLVLRNRLGLRTRPEIERAETIAYETAVETSLIELETDLVFTVSTIMHLHRSWLSEIYDFAGRLREVNVSKGGILFCPAENIPAMLSEFESNKLKPLTPCAGFNDDQLAVALAEVHVELVLIHPFREGNGRLARWLSLLMALQAGKPAISWAPEETDRGREHYFEVLRKGFAGDPRPCTEFFYQKLTSGIL